MEKKSLTKKITHFIYMKKTHSPSVQIGYNMWVIMHCSHDKRAEIRLRTNVRSVVFGLLFQ